MVSDFQKVVYSLVKRIPRGKITTYKIIGNKIGKKGQVYRAVGRALNENKNKDIPCHRVICSNGLVGGYNKGVKNKIKMLRTENIKITNQKIDLKKYLFKF